MEIEISEEKQKKLRSEFNNILNKLENLEHEKEVNIVNENIEKTDQENDIIINELKKKLNDRENGKKDFLNKKTVKIDHNEKTLDSNNNNFIISMLSSASDKKITQIFKKIIQVSNDELLDHLYKLLDNNKNDIIEKDENENEDLDIKNVDLVSKRLIKNVKKIDSILEIDSWVQQEEKTNTLQHQVDSHRAYLFNHKLGFINIKSKRAECCIDKISGINYFNYIKGGKDVINDYKEQCNCMNYQDILNCKICSYLRNSIASRSCGVKYEKNNLPKWNITFAAGALRSKKRVFHGTYNVRARTRLTARCASFITFSMILPFKDEVLPNSGYCEEITIGFNQQFKNKITLFIKSDISPTLKKKVLIPITIKDIKFTRSEYNDYTLEWHKDQIKLAVNGKNVYSSQYEHPIPQLPGYTYFIVRPNFDTNSYELLKTIKKNIGPNIKVNSFKYIPEF